MPFMENGIMVTFPSILWVHLALLLSQVTCYEKLNNSMWTFSKHLDVESFEPMVKLEV